tara:strand:- start:6118 stop:7104 length:987 start_codon:yes stop_codon:yes gene_type:complete
MKKLLAICFAITIPVLALVAQDAKKKPQTWEEKKASHFKPLTEEEQGKIIAAIPEKPTAEPKSARRILVFWLCEGFIHRSIPYGNFMLQQMGEKTGAFQADLADDYSVFTAENLAKYDLILFNNTTRLKFPDENHRKAIMDFVSSGKGIAGIHAASDNFDNWPEALEMMGGIFNGHPWGAGGEWAFKLNDTGSPINEAFGNEGFWHKDEIYQYNPKTYAGDDSLRVLVSLDMSKSKNISVLVKSKKNPVSEVEAKAREVPVSWIREYNGGRVYYSNLGHRNETNWHGPILQHYLDGIQYALGDLEADATPSTKASDLKMALAPEAPAS